MTRLLIIAVLALATELAQAQATPSLSPQHTNGRDAITLREYVDIRFHAQDEAVKAALNSAALAVAKAESASDKRFEAVNEFRASLADQSRTLMPRAEAEQAFKTLNERLSLLTERVNARDERSAGAGNLWGYIAAVVGLLLAIFAYLTRGKGRA